MPTSPVPVGFNGRAQILMVSLGRLRQVVHVTWRWAYYPARKQLAQRGIPNYLRTTISKSDRQLDQGTRGYRKDYSQKDSHNLRQHATAQPIHFFDPWKPICPRRTCVQNEYRLLQLEGVFNDSERRVSRERCTDHKQSITLFHVSIPENWTRKNK